MDTSTINLLMGILFIVVIPMMVIISLQIFEDDDIEKERKLKWDND